MATDTSPFVLWRFGNEGNTAQLLSLEGWDDSWKLLEGIAVADEFPAGARYRMDPDRPTNTRLSDCLGNREDLPVVSEGVKTFLEGRSVSGIEFLPVGIVNHKGRSANEPYWILNAATAVDCLDVEGSEVELSPFDGMISLMKRMQLDSVRVPDESQIFRVANVPTVTVLRRELAEALDAEGFTALLWKDPLDYRG